MGEAVPRQDFEATVHSVFPEASNLQSGKRGRLITLLTTECADLPQGIRLDTSPGFSFERVLHRGDRIICRYRKLTDVHESLSIDLHQAKRWKCNLPDLDPDEIAPPVIAAWSSVWQALDERQKRIHAEIRASKLLSAGSSGGISFSVIMGGSIRELVKAARDLDLNIMTIVARLIGLGPGLTPGGDDFLVGFLAGLYCTIGKKGERLAFFSLLGKMVTQLSSQTNDISRTYLLHATRGWVSSRLVDLAEAIARGEEAERLLLAAEDAMRVGHSSGMEAVTGLLFGLATWGKGLPLVWYDITAG